MIKQWDTLDDQTRLEVMTAVVALNMAFETAAHQVDALYPHMDPETRKEVIAEIGREITQGISLALEYDETVDNVEEGSVAQMLQAAIQPR